MVRMNFNNFEQVEEGMILNPFAGIVDGQWLTGVTSVGFLQDNFGHCQNLDECIQATESEGLKLFFEHLKTKL